MPIITNAQHPVKTNQNEESFTYPKKTVQASTKVPNWSELAQSRQESIPVETPQQDSPKEATLSPQLTILARKEQKLRQQELALKQERESVAREKERFARFEALENKLKAKDYTGLEEYGLSYQDWTNHQIEQAQGSDPRDQKIKELEAKLNKFEQTQVETVNKQYDATISQYKRDIAKTIEQDKFKAIKIMEADEHVLQHILDTFKEENIALTVDEACEDVLQVLMDDAKKFKELEAKPESTPAQSQEKVLPPPRTKTLTNQIPRSEPSQPRNQFQHMSPKERLAAAIARASKQ